ncbi:odorant receptor coreceptor-like [Periplaneta americana]|uniref:odorant receptor coreceptor-like n=1 Tax=Periplaneta americana TaxID=6978 RepID=UPI0037E791CF
MAFQIALTLSQYSNFIKFVFAFCAAMSTPLAFCWYGTAIMDNSLEVYKAAYECQWYHRSNKIKQFLAMIMVRSQKAVCLTGSKFYIISLETFGTMMNTIYAYFTLLKNMYEN